MSYQLNVVLPSFEGPLDLLLHLLEKNDIDIYDIPIHLIAEQFIAYIDRSEQRSIDDMSAFVVMAAQLLEIKSKMLLPIHSDQGDDLIAADDPRYDLVQRLLEYKRYKDAAEKLQRQHADHAGICLQRINEIERYKTVFDPQSDLEDIDIGLLVEALNEVIGRIPRYDRNRREYFDKLVRDYYTVEQKLADLELRFEAQPKWTFRQLVADARDKMEVVVIFLALLEFMRDNHLKIYQAESFSEIILEKEAA